MSPKIGITGAGQAGERHTVGFAAAPGADVIGIADVVGARATDLAERFGT
jgi:predicted dehydrogenase